MQRHSPCRPWSEVSCCGCGGALDRGKEPTFDRRVFLTASAATSVLMSNMAQKASSEPAAPGVTVTPIIKPLRVQPVFNCHIYERKPQTSWRVTGAINDLAEMQAEEAKIRQELEAFVRRAEFPIEMQPLVRVENVEEAAQIAKTDFDAMIIFAARRNVPVLEALARPDRWNIMFVRHRSGPLYYMYIGAHVHYLRKRRDFFAEPAMDIHDVVVDDYQELLWRLRALFGLKNTLGKKFLCIGQPSGWGAEGNLAPQIAAQNWKFDYVVVSYEDLGKRIAAALAHPQLLSSCQRKARDYVAQRGVSVEIPLESVERAFLLNEVFLKLLAEAGTDAITVHNCMTTIMSVSETTACLPLTLLNDAGLLAFCESDFVAIPAGVLMRYIAGTPAFFCNPSWPHQGVVTVSHCTAPRRMNGKDLEPVRILTHYESDFGAATKVEMRKGQSVTVVDADFAGRRWLGFQAQIIDTPFFPICRTQLDLSIEGDWQRLIEEIRGFHWIVVYGRYLREAGYAVKKAGLDWLAIT